MRAAAFAIGPSAEYEISPMSRARRRHATHGLAAHLTWLLVLLGLACGPKVPARDATDAEGDPPIPEDVQAALPPGEPHVFVLDPARLLEHKVAFQKDREHPS